MRAGSQGLRAFIDDLKSRIDIVSAISPHVRLTARGKTLKGLCPFHQEKTPSFIVNPERRYYHCFGCGEHGDVLRFLQKMRFGGDFMGMLRVVGREHGMGPPPPGRGTGAAPGAKGRRRPGSRDARAGRKKGATAVSQGSFPSGTEEDELDRLIADAIGKAEDLFP